jgi:hypothetical protein
MSTKLHEIVANANLSALRDFLEEDANCAHLNTGNQYGELPLCVAVKGKNLKLAEALIAHGADVNAMGAMMGTNGGYAAIHFAARNGDMDALDLLVKSGASIDVAVGEDGWTPLHCAAFCNHSTALRFLVDHGADVNLQNKHGVPAMAFLAKNGRSHDAKYLADAGASFEVDEGTGDSMLHFALHYREWKKAGEYDMPEAQYDVAVILVVAGASPSLPNRAKEKACEPLEDEIPSLQNALWMIASNAELLRAAGTFWSFLTLVGADEAKFENIGVSAMGAKSLVKALTKTNKERLAYTKRRAEEQARDAAKSAERRAKFVAKEAAEMAAQEKEAAAEAKATADKAMAAAAAVPAGTDPSNGACPHFQNKEDVAATDAAPANVDPSNGARPGGAAAADIPTDGSDPSNGACPHFQKQPTTPVAAAAIAPAPITLPAATPLPQALVHTVAPADPIKLDINFVMQNSTAILGMLLAFFFGMVVEQRFGRN